jgi:flagellar hook assembly protein FlgD
LKVTNIVGQDIRTLVNENKTAGFYEVKWDGNNEQGHRVSTGVYLYSLESNGFVQIRKMLIVQ